MQETLSAYFPELLRHEGGYVDHPADPGGATKYGITIGTLSKWRGKPATKADVKALSPDEARDIYRSHYWSAVKGDDLPAGVDALAFDIAVNHGVGRWKQWAPIIKGLSAKDAVRAISERRRRFYRSLPTFKTFGKGWMRRADEVESWSLMWAEARAGDDVSSVKSKTMVTSKTGAASIAVAVAGATATVKETVDQVNSVRDTASSVVDLSKNLFSSPYIPLICLGIILAGCAFIWYDRRQKLKTYGI